MFNRAKLTLLLAVFGLLCLCPLLFAQEGGSTPSGSSTASKHATTSATGCLKQGSESGGYYLTGQDGKVYELFGKSVDFSKHVNHTVTVTGTEKKMSAAKEAKMAASETSEAAGKAYTDLQVTTLTHVSDTCTP
jgi:hypothetical protein